jgi:hypothetical protein
VAVSAKGLCSWCFVFVCVKTKILRLNRTLSIEGIRFQIYVLKFFEVFVYPIRICALKYPVARNNCLGGFVGVVVL